ncbi:hypothetical protein JAAARDRAFT_29626 [Jaapia argillacea MUCL 33604]|uniref:Phytocyanin domain-containing protein n=1 Tax=Jaapia argillacea MUCL 33604 TaxID=933084 RepID=A0A067QBR2_9AGAM|nr:hypothetical protein JAAARDRAFT_29626 [Jaapia argillacea MUCL 33604]
MFFSAAIVTLGLALFPFASATVHDVTVGGSAGNLTYTPEAIFASVGDQVVFHFQQKNHTATQSSFANPCGLKDGGFDTGFMPVPANQTDNFPTYTITVNDTNPIWVYCRQAANTAASHCGKGMVFAVNCGADGSANSFTAFKNAALAIGAGLAASATPVATAAYGGVTIPPAPSGVVATQTVTVQSSTWTTVYTSYPGSPAPTPASLEGTVHKIIVGGPGTLLFSPSNISAQPRDVVVFEFHQKNHTVTQSSFADPCRPLTNATTNVADGFDSGFFPVSDNTTEFPTWNFTVTDTAPVWAYCRQKTPSSHCGAGMVFAINAVESSPRNFSAFLSLAEQLNGTAAAANAPSSAAAPTSTSKSGAARVGAGALTVVLGALGVAAAML